jgi:hypothetical protein
MTTRLDKTLKREILLDGRPFIVTLSPEGLKVTQKGRRIGVELGWADVVSGDAALAAALNASVGKLEAPQRPARAPAAAKSAAKAKPAAKASPVSRRRPDRRPRSKRR